MTKVSISHLNKADVLAALYNAASPQGMGFMQYNPESMTSAQAEELLSVGNHKFDYLYGRAMKITIVDPLETSGYNDNNGNDAAETVIASLSLASTSNKVTETIHEHGLKKAARKVKQNLDEPDSIGVENDVTFYKLGLKDVAGPLNDAVDKALRQ